MGGINWGGIAQIPIAYSQEQTNDAKRTLDKMRAQELQQNINTQLRQAPLQDQLLKAQIAHYGRPNQSQIDNSRDLQGLQALLKFGQGSGQMSAVPQAPGAQPAPQQPGPSPYMMTPPQDPTTGQNWRSDNFGAQSMLPGAQPIQMQQGPQGMNATLPDYGTGAQPQGQPQPAPIAGSGPMPQAPQQQGPMDQMQQLQNVLQSPQASPQQKLWAYQHLQEAQAQKVRADQLALAMRREQALEGYRDQSLGIRQQEGNLNRASRERDTNVKAYTNPLATPDQVQAGMKAAEAQGSPAKDRSEVATMVRSTLGLDSATVPTNDQMKALVGKTLKTSGGKTFVFYDKGDGSVGYTEAE